MNLTAEAIQEVAGLLSEGIAPKGFKSFTRSDWSSFAGADKLPDGREPLIAYATTAGNDDAIIVVSGAGDSNSLWKVEVVYDYEDGEQSRYDTTNKSEAIIMKIASGILVGVKATGTPSSIARKHGLKEI